MSDQDLRAAYVRLHVNDLINTFLIMELIKRQPEGSAVTILETIRARMDVKAVEFGYADVPGFAEAFDARLSALAVDLGL